MARVLTWAGVLIAAAGVFILAWVQLDMGNDPGPFAGNVSYRLQNASIPLMVIALGVLIVAAGQILATMKARTT